TGGSWSPAGVMARRTSGRWRAGGTWSRCSRSSDTTAERSGTIGWLITPTGSITAHPTSIGCSRGGAAGGWRRPPHSARNSGARTGWSPPSNSRPTREKSLGNVVSRPDADRGGACPADQQRTKVIVADRYLHPLRPLWPNIKLTCPAAIPIRDNYAQEAPGNKTRGRVRCSDRFGATTCSEYDRLAHPQGRLDQFPHLHREPAHELLHLVVRVV